MKIKVQGSDAEIDQITRILRASSKVGSDAEIDQITRILRASSKVRQVNA